MFKEPFKKDSKVDIELKVALHLEKAGFNDAALHLITKVTRENPSCMECKDHMSRMYAKDEKFINSEDAKNFLKNMK